MSTELKVNRLNTKKISMQQSRQDEARQRTRSALQRWQEACGAWLTVKSRICSRKDDEAIRRERVLKSLIDQAADELKHAFQIANAV
jgi:hypothetical protein